MSSIQSGLVPCVPGKVEAIARNEAGEVIAKDQVETAGKPAGVRLRFKRRTRDCSWDARI